jgi:hypothetical protein
LFLFGNRSLDCRFVNASVSFRHVNRFAPNYYNFHSEFNCEFNSYLQIIVFAQIYSIPVMRPIEFAVGR